MFASRLIGGKLVLIGGGVFEGCTYEVALPSLPAMTSQACLSLVTFCHGLVFTVKS